MLDFKVDLADGKSKEEVVNYVSGVTDNKAVDFGETIGACCCLPRPIWGTP